MRTTKTIEYGMTALAICTASALAQVDFDAGSDGTFGAIDVTTGTVTLEMPPDGIFHTTTINVAAGATLTFNRNPLNTPVYLLATGDITIEGRIIVSGQTPNPLQNAGGVGGPGGFDGGTPGFGALVPPGAGLGPGGGKGGTLTITGCPGPGQELASGAGRGAYRLKGSTACVQGCATGTCGSFVARAADGETYGSDLLIPLVGGSGGGGTIGSPGSGGGGGGGAVLLASSSRVSVSGFIFSRGGDAVAAGSGGAIRIVAPVVEGSGFLDVNGGLDTTVPAPAITRGGMGRVRVDAIDRTSLGMESDPPGIMSVGSVLIVFPAPVQRLDIVEVAGQLFPEGQPDPIMISLPFGTPTAQTVTVQARGFSGLLPIRVVLTPDTGDPIVVDTDIDMTLGDPMTVTVPVVLPENILTHIMAWTR